MKSIVTSGLLIFCLTVIAGSPFRRNASGEPAGFNPSAPFVFHVDQGALNENWDHERISGLLNECIVAWEGIPGSRLVMQQESLPTDVEDVLTTVFLTENGFNPVVFDRGGSILPQLGFDAGLGAVGFPFNFVDDHFTTMVVVINGPAVVDFDEDRLKAEVMQAIGAGFGLSASYTGELDPALAPVMSPLEMVVPSPELKADDVSGFLALYGAGDQPGFGSLAGEVRMPDGISPAEGVNMVARNLDDPGVVYSAFSEMHTGAFNIGNVRPGDYSVQMVDAGLNNRMVFGPPMRTDNPEPRANFLILSEYKPRILGAFPGAEEFYNSEESSSPLTDDPQALTRVRIEADSVTEGIVMVANHAERPVHLVYPWISNQAGQFESILVANNTSDTPMSVRLTARREDGSSQSIARTIPAGGFLEEAATSLFPELGSGAGYAVELEAPDEIKGRWVTNSLQSASGASPSQGVGVVVPDSGSDRAGKRVLFGYLPAGENTFAAPVIVNLDPSITNVDLSFYNRAGEKVGEHRLTNVHPLRPYARLVSQMIDTEEDVYMIAETEGSLITGVSFVFDLTFFETAIGNGAAIDGVGDREWVFPWVSNNAGQFESIVAVNNYGAEPVEVSLTARRRGGESEAVTRTIPAFGFLAEQASELFANLGSGGGYSVTMDASSATVTGQWVTNNLAAASGKSPGQGVAVARNQARERAGESLMLGYLPVTGSRTAAPVIVNLGDAPTDITLDFYDQQGNLIHRDRSLTGIQPLRPNPLLANSILPEGSGNVHLVAHGADQPITGVVFAFDQTFFEPAIGNGSASEVSKSSGVYAFTNANIIPMDRERVLTDYTLIVRDERITRIGPSESTPIPDEAEVVDASGQYILPGLADAHTHITASGDLILLLANGVTSVLNMGDAGYHSLRLKQDVETGKLDGPTIYNSAFVRGPADRQESHLTVRNGEEARAFVAKNIESGYDFIKLYDNVRGDALLAASEETAARGVAMIGHLPLDLPMEEGFKAGLVMVAHMEEYLNDFFQYRLQDELIDDAIRITSDYPVYVTTTMSTIEALAIYAGGNLDGYGQLLQRPGVNYLEPAEMLAWNLRVASNDTSPNFSVAVDFLKTASLRFMRSGIPMLLGTDAPIIPGMVSGFAMHEEMRLLHDSGWSQHEVLTAATRNFGTFINTHVKGSSTFGTLAEGSRADLILLPANPLENLSLLRQPEGVMARGRWYASERLQQMLDDVAAGYATGQQSIRPKHICH